MFDHHSELLAAIRAATGGYGPETIEPGKVQRFATADRRSDDSGWLVVFADGRGAVFGDWRRSFTETWSAIPRERMTPKERSDMVRQVTQAKAQRREAQETDWKRTAAYIARLWAECLPVTAGDPVDRYLCQRLAVSSLKTPACLRLHTALRYTHGGQPAGEWPAMVGQVTDACGQMVALHRTWLTPEGQKAPVPGKVKKLTPACGSLAGASIRLYEPRAGQLGAAEGIETALAAFLGSGVPTVSTYSAGALAAFTWPASIQRLVIFADADEAGRVAARTLKARAFVAGLQPEVLEPDVEGNDWCDVWANRFTGLEAAA